MPKWLKDILNRFSSHSLVDDITQEDLVFQVDDGTITIDKTNITLFLTGQINENEIPINAKVEFNDEKFIKDLYKSLDKVFKNPEK
jgi:hypothetical protein